MATMFKIFEMLTKFGDNQMNPLEGVFKSSPHAIVKKVHLKSQITMGGANGCNFERCSVW